MDHKARYLDYRSLLQRCRWIVALCLVWLPACAGPNYDRSVQMWVVDFTGYTEDGFLFTPHEYAGDYDAIGLISVRITPEIKTKETGETDEYGPVEKTFSENLDPQDALTALHDKAVALGADGIMDLTIASFEFLPVVGSRGIKASGFAIKRKGAF